jgi:hypothetical protein
MDSHFEGSLTEKFAHRWNEKEYTKGGRGAYIRVFCVITRVEC